MNAQIALILAQDGIVNGAIYALLALSILMVFSATRVLFIPQGEFTAMGGLAMAAIQSGHWPRLVWLLLALVAAEALLDLDERRRVGATPWITRAMLLRLAYPVALALLLWRLPLASLPMGLQALLTLGLVVPMAPPIYRIFFQPLSAAPVLVLLIVSMAVHFALVGLILLAFGPEGAKTTPFSEAVLELGPMRINSQSLWVLGVTMLLIAALYGFFDRTLYGKALRAAAINRLGARLMGISPRFAGRASFWLAGFIGALSGILIAPITTLYYDSGFVISLKGFVGSIIGGLVSYPLAALGALLVGLLEAYASFAASGYKDVIVFSLIIPFLLWRSLASHPVEEDE